MGIKLPTKKGERVTIWHTKEREAEGPVRVVLISDGKGRWSMETEGGDPYQDEDERAEEYEDGDRYLWTDDAMFACFTHDPEERAGPLHEIMVAMAMAMRGAAILFRPPNQIESPSFWPPNQNTVCRIKGNRRLIIITDYGYSDGLPRVAIRTNKPMDAGQWLTATGALAEAMDDYQRYWSGES